MRINMVTVSNLKELRKKYKFKNRDMRTVLGISKQTYNKYERSNRVPANSIPKLVQIFGKEILPEETREALDFTGLTLKVNCLFHNVSKETVAERMGVTVSTVNKMIANSTFDAEKYLPALSDLFDPIIYLCYKIKPEKTSEEPMEELSEKQEDESGVIVTDNGEKVHILNYCDVVNMLEEQNN